MSIAREQPRARTTSRGPLLAALVLGLLLLGGLGYWAWSRTRPVPAMVVRRDLIAGVPVTGDVVAPPDQRADIMAPYRAPVVKVYTTIGANVDRGDTLVEVNLANVQSYYEQARANVRAAETAYANAQREYAASISAAQREVSAARSALRSVPATTSGTSSVTTTPEGATVTTTTPPLSTGPDPAAAERLSMAEAALQQATSTRDVALTPYRQQLESAREAFQAAQGGRKAALIRSPIAGTVLALTAQPGTEIGVDRKVAVATVVDLDELQLQGELKPRFAGQVKAGMPVEMTFTEVPGEKFEGKVHSLITTPAKPLGKPGYAVLLHIENRKGLVKPGMKGTASVKLGEVKDALAVPEDAVQEDSEGRPFINVMRNGNWERVSPELGLSDGQFVEVKSGLKEGDTVQVKPDLL